MSGKGDLTFTHPRVKPLRVGGEFEVNSDRLAANSKLEFDIFSKPLDMIVISYKFGSVDTSGQGYKFISDFECYSKGLGFTLKSHENVGLSIPKRELIYGYNLVLPVDGFKFGADALVSMRKVELSAVAFGEEFLKGTAQYDPENRNLNTEASFK